LIAYKEILRLTAMGISQRGIAASAGCSKATVLEVQRRVVAAGLELAPGFLPHVEQGIVHDLLQGTTFAGFAVHSPPKAGISARTSPGGSGAVAIFLRPHRPDFPVPGWLD
jgi:hypothetical protein